MTPSDEKSTEKIYSLRLTGPVQVEALHADAANLLFLMAGGQFGGTLKDFWLIRLDPLKDLYGKRWDEHQGVIHDIIREEIAKEVTDGGLTLRYDDLAHLVVLPPQSRADDANRMEALAAAIQEKAAGENFHDPLVEIWRAESLVSDGFRFTKIERPTLVPEPHAQAQVQAPAQAQVIDGDGEGRPSPPPLKNDTAADKRLIMGDVELFYSPVWDVRKNQVFAYLCEPEWTMADAERLHEDSVEAAFRSKRARYVVDVAILHKAQAAFNDLLEHDRLASIILPIHYHTLMDETFLGRYLAECNNLIGAFYHLVAFEIVGLPQGIDAEAFNAMAARLRPYCRKLFVRVQPDFLNWKDLANGDVFAVSLDLRDDQRPEAEILKTLEDTMDHTAGTNLYVCAHGLKSNALSVAAICAGFDLLGSDTIAQTLEGWPMDDYLVKPIDLFKSLISGK